VVLSPRMELGRVARHLRVGRFVTVSRRSGVWRKVNREGGTVGFEILTEETRYTLSGLVLENKRGHRDSTTYNLRAGRWVHVVGAEDAQDARARRSENVERRQESMCLWLLE